MREFKYVITDPEGIHARPAGELVKEAKKYEGADEDVTCEAIEAFMKENL